MGFDKFRLPVGSTTLVERIVGQLEPHVGNIVLAIGASEDSSLQTATIAGVKYAYDLHQSKGPMEGIRVGLSKLANDCELAFVTACDVPHFQPQILSLLIDAIGDGEASIPVENAPSSRVYGMTAVYRTEIHQQLEHFILNDQLRVSELVNLLDATKVPIDKIKELDPELDCLSNINNPADYFSLLQSLNLECPKELYEQLKNQ